MREPTRYVSTRGCSMSSAEAAPSGFNGFLEQAGLNVVEFAICLAFWVGVAILSSVVSMGDILSKYLPAILQTHLHLLAADASLRSHGPPPLALSQASGRSLSSSTASPRRPSTCLLPLLPQAQAASIAAKSQ